MHAIIHPKWLIDEYAMIFRVDVWFSPIIAPNVVDIRIIIIDVFDIFIVCEQTWIGAIFCHVDITRHIIHLILFIISGYHIWKGGIPIFIIILSIMIFMVSIYHIFVVRKFLFNIDEINIIDAILCVRKYIIDLWDRKLFFELNIRGIKVIILISSPIHILNQFDDLITKIDENVIININNIFLDVLMIEKKINLYI